jgi:hypothetical protein
MAPFWSLHPCQGGEVPLSPLIKPDNAVLVESSGRSVRCRPLLVVDELIPASGRSLARLTAVGGDSSSAAHYRAGIGGHTVAGPRVCMAGNLPSGCNGLCRS